MAQLFLYQHSTHVQETEIEIKMKYNLLIL